MTIPSCCDEPSYRALGHPQNTGERVEHRTECVNCGAEFVDVFTYSDTLKVASGDPDLDLHQEAE